MAAIMAAALAASVLSGCGGKTKDEAGTATGGAGGQEAASADETVNLRFVSWQTAYKDLNEKVAEAYTKEHPNITVTFDYYGDMTATEYYKKWI